MKLCIINPYHYIFQGGIEKQIYDEIERLSEKGIEVNFVAPMERGNLQHTKKFRYATEYSVGSRMVSLPNFYPPTPVFNPMKFRQEVKRAIKDSDIIEIFSEYISPFIYGTDKPIVHSQQCSLDMPTTFLLYRGLHSMFFKQILRRYYSKCKKILPISNSLMKDFEEQFEISRDKMQVIPNGVNVDIMKYDQELADTFRNKWNIHGSFIFCAGRVLEEKGFQILLKSIALMKDKKITLGIAGKGPYMNKLKEISKRLNIRLIEFGFLDKTDIVAAYSACEVFVTPSTWKEPFGIVNIEAMACSKPVIGPNIGGISDIITHEETGLLYSDPFDYNSLSQKIQIILDDPELGRKMGRAGRIKVEENFNWDKIIDQKVQIYNDIVSDSQ